MQQLAPDIVHISPGPPHPAARPAAATPILSVRKLTRRYGGLAAVADVDLDVAAADLLGIIGPNGAGKTTLFNLMSGFEQPSAGTVSLDGRRIDGLRPHRIARRGLSRTFQNLRVAPGLSVFDNVSAGAIGQVGFPVWCAFLPHRANRRGAEIERRTWAALQRVGLENDSERTAGSLSYGKRKYLEIARALAAQPRLLILDEPAAGLNETESAQLAAFIRGLHDEGMTVMLVEHDMKLVMTTCTRVVVLAAGRKIAEGTPSAVRADPLVQEAYLGSERDD
jgi:branched-chain amino acid transport system ATP-binding protein